MKNIVFLILLLSFSFLITKNPNYTRLLVFLPFIAYLAVEGLFFIAETVGWLFKTYSSRIKHVFYIVGLSTIFVWNMTIWADFVIKGLQYGNDVGGTARYTISRLNIPGYTFYIATSPEYPYYSWGQLWQWEAWLGFFKNEN